MRTLPPGLYDLLVTASRAADLAPLGDAALCEPPDPPLAAQLLARLVHDRLVQVLKGLHGEKDPDRVAAQVDLANRVLALVEAANTNDAADAVLSPAQRLLFVLLGRAREPLARLSDAWRALWDAPALRAELRELLAILDDRRGLTHPLEGRLRELPLHVHATYALDEVTAALDEVDKHGGVRRLREGVLWSEQHQVDLLFVTLDKREEDYSPTTLYQDYPISPTRFHWESQSTVDERMKVGQRYVSHAARGSEVWLFVRRAKHARPDITAPYTFVGPCRYVRHQGGRPMAVEWELARAMPAWLYQETKLAAG
jgi:hypothetical protein